MKKAGILGGGQLGRMLLQSAANYPVETFVMESSRDCPAASLCHHFTVGNITDFEDVYHFGKNLDVITVEIENVNVEALEKLETEGVVVIPSCKALKIIKNKIFQKNHFKDNQTPTSDHLVVRSMEELKQNSSFFPAVQKLATGGYDGRGVALISSVDDVENGFDEDSILEKKINIKKELAVIVAVDRNMNITSYPVTEMVFNNNLNLLDYQFCPADIDADIFTKSTAVAEKAVLAFESPGLFAVELFLDINNNILVNEIAPRVHNSGHHTIEASVCSQFDMLMRIMLDYPLGNTQTNCFSSLINIVGNAGISGNVVYNGIKDILKIPGCYIHIYGKSKVKPGRKMGHITIVGNNKEEVKTKTKDVKGKIFVRSSE